MDSISQESIEDLTEFFEFELHSKHRDSTHYTTKIVIAPILAFFVNGTNIFVNSFMTIILNIALTISQLIFGILFQPIFTFVNYI